MQNSKSIEKKPNPKVLYKGIDWLRIGFFVKAHNEDEYNLFIDNLRDFINLPFEEQYFKIPALPIKNFKPEPYKVRVKTTAHIYPYKVLLVEENFNISIRLGNSLKDYEVINLKRGKTPTPNVLIEIGGLGLRPQIIPHTDNFLKSFFHLINNLGGKVLGFIFSRIDYALDFPDKDSVLKLLILFQNLRKAVLQTEEEKITLKGKVANFKNDILKLGKNAKHIGIGSPQTILAVYYEKRDADPLLKAIYTLQSFEAIPHRLEIRVNNHYFKRNRKVYLKTYTSLEELINLTTELVLNVFPEEIKHLAEKPTPFFPNPNQLTKFNHQTLKALEKIERNLTLYEESLRFLTQLTRLLKNGTTFREVLITLKRLIKTENPKAIERIKRKDLNPQKVLKEINKLLYNTLRNG